MQWGRHLLHAITGQCLSPSQQLARRAVIISVCQLVVWYHQSQVPVDEAAARGQRFEPVLLRVTEKGLRVRAGTRHGKPFSGDSRRAAHH